MTINKKMLESIGLTGVFWDYTWGKTKGGEIIDCYLDAEGISYFKILCGNETHNVRTDLVDINEE